jgi:poly(A) polymerase
METKLHPDWLNWPQTRALSAAFAAREAPLRFVGGGVRDGLLGRPVKDVDAATPLLPDAVIALLEAAGIAAVPTGIDHGTVTAVIDKKHFEITTLRRDVATDGRHAQVAFTDDWQLDAARRDFTMNALYLSPLSELFDYFGGTQDAKAGRVRFIGEATARIKEDYLRILRFFRFTAWYGKEQPDKEALAACAAHAAHIAGLSGERIRSEMLKLFSAPRPSATIELMQGEVLRHTFGFTVHNTGNLERLERIEAALSLSPDPLLRLALLLPSLASLEHLADKWRLSNDMRDRLKMLLEYAPRLKAAMTLAEQKSLLRKLGAPAFQSLALLRWAQESESADVWKRIHALAKEWAIPEFPLGGKDLQAIGIAEGRQMGQLLRSLEAAWEESDYRLGKEELLGRAKP